jgi:hypothetical protein
MIHRFTIPRYVWWFVALAAICIGGTFVLWAAHVWTPIQRHYLWAYVWSSRPGADPSSQVTIRWFYKTAPGRQAELASEDEVVSDAASGHALALSPAARQAGWTDVMLGPKEQFTAATLRPFLERQFFDGNNAWLVVSPPLSCGLVVFCFLLLGAGWLESWLPYERWKLEQTAWFNPTICRCRKLSAMIAKLYIRMMELAAHKTRTVATEEQPVPVPIASPIKPKRTVFSPFGVADDAQKTTYVWSKKDEIE